MRHSTSASILLMALMTSGMMGCQSFPRNRYTQTASAPVKTSTKSSPKSQGLAAAPAKKSQSQNSLAAAHPEGVVLASAQQVVEAPPRHPTGCSCCNHSSEYRPMLASLVEGCEVPAGDCRDGAQVQYVDPQEYLYDGGDHLPRVVIENDGKAVGLQPEDTIVHYETEKGAVCVEPACRAAIYAPRFASVRKVATPRMEDLALGTRSTLQPTVAGSLNERLPSPSLRQPIKVAREQSVGVIEGFRDRNRGVPVARVQPALKVSDAYRPYEDFQLIRNGFVFETDRFQLRRFVAAALVWGSKEEVQVIVDGQQAAIETTVSRAQETVVYEIDGKPCIRICKVASQQMAAPGDEVDFTIRVDNVGDREVRNLVVLDSLTARLEYVEESQQSNWKGDFQTRENEVGSHVLEWRFDQTLKPGEGGIIRFRCRVR